MYQILTYLSLTTIYTLYIPLYTSIGPIYVTFIDFEGVKGMWANGSIKNDERKWVSEGHYQN
jgi:hypothetical protein